ncbi:MAG: T9SS type A sorting domain-containing protein [Candidatus Coatesbacteria bacterium]|nr:T9SS type A sorting domain-containing protein [Candidatus Coatesbacteria bacterium]
MKIYMFILTLLLSLVSTSYLFSENYALSGGLNRYISYWRLSDGNLMWRYTGYSTSAMFVAVSNNGNYCLSTDGYYSSIDSVLNLHYTSDGSCIGSFKGHQNLVLSACFNPDNNHCYSGSWDLTIKEWQISDRKCTLTFTGHQDGVTSLVCSDDGKYLLSGSWDHTMKYWNITTNSCIRTFTHSDKVSSVSISKDGRYGLSAGGEEIKYWDLQTGSCLRTITNNDGSVNSISISNSGKYALSGSSSQLKYWDLSTGECIRTFSGHTSSVNSVVISPDDRNALSGSNDYCIKYWRVSDGICLQTMRHGLSVTDVCFNTYNWTGFNNDTSSYSLPAKSFAASPNPFSTRLSVSMPSSGAIYSLTGQLIMNLSKGKHTLDTSKWKQGVYILKAGKECKKVVKIE